MSNISFCLISYGEVLTEKAQKSLVKLPRLFPKTGLQKAFVAMCPGYGILMSIFHISLLMNRFQI